MHLKKLVKIAEFFVAILIMKMEENRQQFQHIMLYYLKKKKKLFSEFPPIISGKYENQKGKNILPTIKIFKNGTGPSILLTYQLTS